MIVAKLVTLIKKKGVFTTVLGVHYFNLEKSQINAALLNNINNILFLVIL